MESSGKLPDPKEENRNKERRLSLENGLRVPRIQLEYPSECQPVSLSDFDLSDFDLPDSMREILETLAHEKELSVKDVIRKSLGLYALVQARRKADIKCAFIAISEDGKPEIKEIIN